MARRGGASPALSRREGVLGGILLICYLMGLPSLALEPVFALAERLTGLRLEAGTRDGIYYGLLFLLALAVFRGLWSRATRALLAEPGRTLAAAGVGLVAFYGLGELTGRLLNLLLPQAVNLNDAAVSARLGDAPGRTLLILAALAPAVEETLFRGYVFGLLRPRSRGAAYAASALLFALPHVWQYAAGNPAYLLLAAQYIVPGLVLAWAYERGGSLWSSVLLHSAVNALAAGAFL